MTDENTALVKTPGGSIYADGDSFSMAQRMAQSLAASSIVPDAYRGQQGLANCLVALEIAHRLGTSPLMIMQNMQPVHGKPQWTSSFLIGLINSCGRFSPLRFAYDNSENPTACYAYATDLKSGETLRGTTITMAMAQAEGWTTRKGSKWKTMPAQMLMYRAASFWARAYASDLTLGIRSQDEVTDIEAVEVSVDEPAARTEQFSAACKSALDNASKIRTLREAQDAAQWVVQQHNVDKFADGETEAILAKIEEREAFLSRPLTKEQANAVIQKLSNNPSFMSEFFAYFNIAAETPPAEAITQQQHFEVVMS